MRDRPIKYAIVYLQDEDVYGELISFGFLASTVRYFKDGIENEVVLLNEDFEIIEEANIDIEEEY